MSLKPPDDATPGAPSLLETFDARLDVLESDLVYVAAPTGVSATDTAAIAAADVEAASEDKAIMFRPGTYVAEGLSPSTGVRWLSRGATKIQLKASSTLDLVSIAEGTTDVVIDGLELDGNRANVSSTNNVVVIDGARHRITNCYVHDAENDGIVIQTGADHIQVDNNRVYTTGRYGITCQGTALAPVTNITISDNHVKDSGETGQGAGLGIVGVGKWVSFVGNVTESTGGDGCAAYNHDNRHILVSGNVFNDPANNGMHLGGNEVEAVGNLIYSPAQYGIYVENDDVSAATGFVVSSNTIDDPGAQSGVHVGNYSQGAVTGNKVNSAQVHGINLQDCSSLTVGNNLVRSCATGSGIRLVEVQKAAVTGNVSEANASRGIAISDGGGTASTDIIITGNLITGNTGHGILSADSTDKLLIANNRLYSNTAGNFSLVTGAGNRVKDNLTDDSASAASAASVTLPLEGPQFFTITGTTNITGLSAANNADRKVTLKFADVLTFTDGSGTLRLAGNYTTSADDTITLVCDGAAWYEVARSGDI